MSDMTPFLSGLNGHPSHEFQCRIIPIMLVFRPLSDAYAPKRVAKDSVWGTETAQTILQ